MFVAYRDTMRLRIPVSSTNLEGETRTPGTKWTREAIREFPKSCEFSISKFKQEIKL